MRIGVLILPAQTWRESEPMWRYVEDCGFSHAWTFDHLSWRALPGSVWHSSFPTLAAAARCTTRIGLGPLVATPSLRHPAVLAKDAATLNDVSGGRFVLMMGSGAASRDEHMLGVRLSPPERLCRLRESVMITRRLLAGETVTFRGEHFSVNGASLYPSNKDGARIPVGVAASGPAAMRIAAEHADIWVTNGRPGRDGSPRSDLAILGAQYAMLNHALEQVGRHPRSIRRLAAIVDAHVPLLRSADIFGKMAMRLAEIGYTDVIIPFPRSSPPFKYPLGVLKVIARDIMPDLANL